MNDHDFDIISYMETLTSENILCQSNGYRCVSCSGIEALEGVLDNYKNTSHFVCVDDSNDANIFSEGGWFKRRTVTLFFLARQSFKDLKSRAAQIDLCREIYRQFLSRLINDRYKFEDNMMFVRLDNIYTRDINTAAMGDICGMYMMFYIDEPIDLTYDDSLWTTT